MFRKRITEKPVLKWLILICMIVIFPVSNCVADEDQRSDESDVYIHEISPPAPEADFSKIDISRAAEDYYDITGTLYIIEKDGMIVVGAKELRLSDGVSIFGIKHGSRVGVKLNNAGEVLVCDEIEDAPH